MSGTTIVLPWDTVCSACGGAVSTPTELHSIYPEPNLFYAKWLDDRPTVCSFTAPAFQEDQESL